MNISEEDKENARDRFRAKIESGFKRADKDGRVRRYDGSYTDEDTFMEGALAEKFGAEFLGCDFNDEVYAHGGDGGIDFMLSTTKGEKEVEVIWLGFIKGTKKVRETGHLIVNPDQPTRWADIYVIISGCIDGGYKFVGWTSHKLLVSNPRKDFGFGEKFAMHTDNLLTYERLVPFLKK